MRGSLTFVRVSMALSTALFATAAAADAAKVRNFEHEHVAGELLVKLTADAQLAPEAVLSIVGGKVLRTFRASGAMRVKLPAGLSAAATKSAALTLAEDPRVEYVEANNVIRLNETTPNDPQLGALWGMTKITATRAWDINTGSKDVVVGVIDTGVDYGHPDLAANYWYNEGERGTDGAGLSKETNGVDDDANGYVDDFRGWDFANGDNDPMDDHNHGTHCAGTIGGKGNNGIGVVGVNWDVGIVGIKFLTAGGSGTTAGAIESIEYGTVLGVTLTSNSWGGGGVSEPMKAAIQEAHDKNVLFVAAAGNSAANNDRTPNYPSNYDVPNVIAVAATQQNDTLASFSSYGLTTVDLAAPGVAITSTTRNNTYAPMSGTSMATPHVAGAVALIKAQFPDFDGQQLKAKLLASVDAVAALTGKVVTGGRLNLEKALKD